MLAAGTLLISLSVLSVGGNDTTLDATSCTLSYYGTCLYNLQCLNNPLFSVDIDYEDHPTDAPISLDINDWRIDHLGLDKFNTCDPNPCLNGGSCQNKSLKCLCSEPYVGKICQTVGNVCEKVKCGHGDCVVNPNKYPFYECKCNPPYQGPNCTISPSDCYEGNGETYRGVASRTEGGVECLNWHSDFIVSHEDDPFQIYPNSSGLEYNNHCRNPNGEEKPWCFTKHENDLQWDYCNVKKCLEASPPTVTPELDSPQFSQCGITYRQDEKIFGGKFARSGVHPWQVSLQVRPKGSLVKFQHICGGVLLTSCWVLTAAHCLKVYYEYQVVLGRLNIDKEEEGDQTIPVIRTIAHENYLKKFHGLHNDIALLELKVTDGPYCANETELVKTVCLPNQTFPAGKACKISGWGATENQSYSGQLMNARVRLISEEKCKAPHVYGNLLDSSMLCAGTLRGGIDSCKGDSGGPLVCMNDGKQYITGVVSWGEGCGRKNKPGVYTNVYTFIDWIKSIISSTTEPH